MVSKNNFPQQNGVGGVRGGMQLRMNHGVRAAIAPYRKPYKPPMDAALMYTSCQMPTDPLYIDFNKPAPPALNNNNNNNAKVAQQAAGVGGSGPQQQLQQHQRKKHIIKSGKNKNRHLQPQVNGHIGNWQKNRVSAIDNRFNGMQRGPIGFNAAPIMSGGGPLLNRAGRHILPPPPPLGHMGGPPRGGPLPPPHPGMGFQPPPLRGPMPPMNGVRAPPPRPHMLRGRNGRPLHPPLPPPMAPIMGPRMPPRGIPPIVPFNGAGHGMLNVGVGGVVGNANNGGKIKKPNPKLVKQAIKGKSTIKTLKNLVNQYPIDKPWVTNAIRQEYDIKVSIENRLRGHKDDDLFAQFKIQRDKFVAMYEAARDAYLKEEAASVMAKDAKDKQTHSNKNSTVKAGNGTDATPNTNDNPIPNPQNQNQIINNNDNDNDSKDNNKSNDN